MSTRKLARLKATLLRQQGQSHHKKDGGGSGDGDFKPSSLGGSSRLPDGTRQMEIERRELEQAGHRRIAKVNVRIKHDNAEAGDQLQHGEQYQRHPFLDSQRFDGIGVDNPDINLNPDALWIYENERAEQDNEKQLRMERQLNKQHQQSYRSVPTPKPS